MTFGGYHLHLCEGRLIMRVRLDDLVRPKWTLRKLSMCVEYGCTQEDNGSNPAHGDSAEALKLCGKKLRTYSIHPRQASRTNHLWLDKIIDILDNDLEAVNLGIQTDEHHDLEWNVTGSQI